MGTQQYYPPMYSRHNILCNLFAQDSPENLTKTIDFVFSTIKQNTIQLDGIQKAYHKYGNTTPSFNMQSRKKGSEFIHKHKVYFYQEFMRILNSSLSDDDKEYWLLDLFTEIPFLNTPKAGFVVTLSTPFGGCFDSWNMKKFNVDKADISINKKSPSMYSRSMKIRNYQKLIIDCGGTEFLWDQWCDETGKRYSYFKDGVEVSARHIYWLTGKNYEDLI